MGGLPPLPRFEVTSFLTSLTGVKIFVFNFLFHGKGNRKGVVLGLAGSALKTLFVSSSPVRSGFRYLYSMYVVGRVGRPVRTSETLYEAASQEAYQNELLSL